MDRVLGNRGLSQIIFDWNSEWSSERIYSGSHLFVKEHRNIIFNSYTSLEKKVILSREKLSLLGLVWLVYTCFNPVSIFSWINLFSAIFLFPILINL